MCDIPFELLGHEPGFVALGTFFLSHPAAQREEVLQHLKRVFAEAGIQVVEVRAVPVDTRVLGRIARSSLPQIVQVILQRPVFCRTERSFQTRLYFTHQSLRTQLRRAGLFEGFFTVSLSTRTVVYKALVTADKLRAFYPDLADPRFKTRFGLFHRRFSTNTSTTWDKAQPFRLVAHNGEINTIACNRAWSSSREQALGLPAEELSTRHGISDSGSLNEMLEALRFRSSIPRLQEALAITMPPAHKDDSGFYEFWGRAIEPWDGPAFVAFSDGEVVGARLDRNGFRPGRWARTADAFYLASEAGVFGLDERGVLEKGALRGGGGAHVNLATGELGFSDPSESRENQGARFDARLYEVGRLEAGAQTDHAELQPLFSYTKEEVDAVLVPMAATGKEPIGSMGDTARLAVLSDQPRSFFDYFYQTFAQVTNPPVDHIRERAMTELKSMLGRRPNVFEPKTLIPPPPALSLRSPVLGLAEMAWVREAAELRAAGYRNFESVEVNATFARARGPEGLAEALDDLSEKVLAAIRGGCSIVILSDRLARPSRPPMPSLLALRAATNVLDAWGHRLDASIVVDTAEVRSTHHVAALVGYGAAAVCPYRALELVRDLEHGTLKDLSPEARMENLVGALEEGLRKVMSKMGISTVQGYQGSMLFTALGLHDELVSRYFTGTPSPISGRKLSDFGADIIERADGADDDAAALPDTYQLREHRKGLEGERHAMTARLSKRVHEVVEEGHEGLPRWAAWQAFVSEAAEQQPISLRHLLRVRTAETPLGLDDVMPRTEVLRRFGSGAMSFGAISAESQRDLVVAMRRVGGRSGSGEGGENPFYWSEGVHASSKQVASGRFGVTARYLIAGDEIEIKVAQGAKPGEGGQLMSEKVGEAIARARGCRPGTTLISPPPLHDIYSIEDLRELIYELKQLAPGRPVSVKLVAGANIGTIAAGVVKAGADIVHISGGDGGTGAAAISSMKHAGLPWELGLAEVHQTLIEQELREHAILRVDGGLQTGFDVVAAAMLGAEEFGFGKILLVAEGCIMARICQKNTCPRGIATHDPKFKKKYRGTAEMVETYLHYLAEDVRHHLAELGVEHLDQLVGRADLLEVNPSHRARLESRGLSLEGLRVKRPHPRGFRGNYLGEGVSRLNERLLEDAAPALSGEAEVELEREVQSPDRAVLATVSGALAAQAHARHLARLRGEPEPAPASALRVQVRGSAGQGFGAFLTEGIEVRLEGEANDSVAKSMSGGRMIVVPDRNAGFEAESNVILGNAALYGASGGELFVRGRVGDRFAVRNSGASAVVEGAGLHACEYMTGGRVLVLGELAGNAGAGMTGGMLVVPREAEARVNPDSIEGHPPSPEDEVVLREWLARYHEQTGSAVAARYLEAGLGDRFRVWLPRGWERLQAVG